MLLLECARAPKHPASAFCLRGIMCTPLDLFVRALLPVSFCALRASYRRRAAAAASPPPRLRRPLPLPSQKKKKTQSLVLRPDRNVLGRPYRVRRHVSVRVQRPQEQLHGQVPPHAQDAERAAVCGAWGRLRRVHGEMPAPAVLQRVWLLHQRAVLLRDGGVQAGRQVCFGCFVFCLWEGVQLMISTL